DNFIFTDLKPLIKEYTTRLTLNQMILMYDQIIEAHKKLIQNVNPMLVFEQIVIKGVS
ncbi:DNA polymerase III subunit delta', partial [Staphylococcus capitis]